MVSARRRWAVFLGYLAVCVAMSMALASVVTMARGHSLPEEGLIWAVLPIILVFMIFAMWVGTWWMKSIDEAAREAHKWSWFWGGSAGLCLALIVYFIGQLPETKAWQIPSAFAGRTDPMAYMLTGGLAVILLMLLGYGVAWVLWWAWHR